MDVTNHIELAALVSYAFVWLHGVIHSQTSMKMKSDRKRGRVMNNLAYFYPSIILVLIILVVAFIIMFLFFRNSIGFGQFNHKASEIETVKPPRIAPAFFYNKQRTFRFCYTAFIAFDTILLISSLFFSTFTAYMILVPT